MLIGDKSMFAIECEVRDKFDSFVYCNFRIWIADGPIGNWDEEVVLGVVMYAAKVFAADRGNRHLNLADCMSAEELWRHIDRFANADDPSDLRMGLEERYRSRFFLHDIADDSLATVAEVMVVERTDGVQRLLWKTRDGSHVHEIAIPKLTVDQVISEFLDWAETISPTVSKSA